MVDLGQKKANNVCLFLCSNLKGWRAPSIFFHFDGFLGEPFFHLPLVCLFLCPNLRGGERPPSFFISTDYWASRLITFPTFAFFYAQILGGWRKIVKIAIWNYCNGFQNHKKLHKKIRSLKYKLRTLNETVNSIICSLRNWQQPHPNL